MADLGTKSKRVNGNKIKYYYSLRIIRGVKLCRFNSVENKQEILSKQRVGVKERLLDFKVWLK